MIDNGFKSPFPPFNSLFVTLCECLIVIIIKLDSHQDRTLLEKVAGPRADRGGERDSPASPGPSPAQASPGQATEFATRGRSKVPHLDWKPEVDCAGCGLSVLSAGVSL